MKLWCAFLCLILVLSLCACGEPDQQTPDTTQPISQQTEPTTENPLAAASDQSLVEATICSRGLAAWGTMSSVIPRSADGVKMLMNNCPEFEELMQRDSGLASLKEYAPDLIAAYKEQENYRLNAMFMEDLMDYLFPYLANEVEIPIQ